MGRGWHAMISFGESIFVAGGNAGLNKRVDIHETEIYSIMSNQWTMVAPLPLPQSEGGSVFHGGKIYILGGYSWTHQKCVNTIQTYDPATDKWERPGNLPIELSGVKCAILCIPYALSNQKNKVGMSQQARSSRSIGTVGMSGTSIASSADPLTMSALASSMPTIQNPLASAIKY